MIGGKSNPNPRAQETRAGHWLFFILVYPCASAANFPRDDGPASAYLDAISGNHSLQGEPLMRNGTFRHWLLFLFMAALATGCSRSSGRPRVAFVSNNPHGFWTYAERGCEKAAKEMDVELAFRRPSENTSVAQQNIINDLM